MLNRLLIVLDILLVIAAGALAVHLYRVGTATPAARAAPPPASAAPTPPATPTATPTPALATYTVVAERNLFSPTRNEAGPEPPKPTAGTAPLAANAPKPRLYGIVMGRDGGPRAYLEDPRTRRVFGYEVGDTVADSRVERIGNDRVVLRRGGESYEVLLRDPSKPRPAPAPGAAAPAAPPGAPAATPTPAAPGTPTAPSPNPFLPQGTAPQQGFPFGFPGTGAPATPGQAPDASGQPAPPAAPFPFGQGATPAPAPGAFPFRAPIRQPGAPAGTPTQPQVPGAPGS
jgi:Type II secretion system protein C